MKRLICAALVAMFVVFALSSVYSAQAQAPTAGTVNERANVRNGPGNATTASARAKLRSQLSGRLHSALPA